jgi:hypothetical protein
MKKAWIIFQIIILLGLGLTKVHATNDGQGNKYFKENIGIHVVPRTTLNAELVINGNIMINDGTEGIYKILKTDANGLANWEPVSYFPDLDGNNNSYNHLVINNGYFQDLTLNGTTTVDQDGRLSFVGQPDTYILTMYANGFAHWAPNYGANGESSDPLWKEEFNTLLPKTNNGENDLVIGDNTLAGANIAFTKNGGAQFNQNQILSEDVNLGTDHSYFGVKVEADEDQVGIKLGSPDTRLDVRGMFALRSNGSDFTASADPFTSVYWTAKNSAFGNNGDVLAKINNSAEEKVFKLVDFNGSTTGSNGGVATLNGLILENATPERLVRTNSNKKLVSELDLISNGTSGFTGVGVSSPESELEIGDAVLDFVDGVDDVSVRGSIEADGTIYATNFVGDSTGLQFNGVDIYNALIHTSKIFGVIDFNGNATVELNGQPWFLDANLEFSGDKTFRTGNKFEIMGAPSGNPEVAFHVNNGRVGIMTTSPQALFDVNGQIMYRDGNQANGRLLASTDSNGSAQWQDIDFDTVQYATNVDNATTANMVDNMNGASIMNSDFLGGTVNGSTLVNVDFSSTPYASEWVDGADGLYPIDGPAENVLVGGNSLATAPISMEANGTFSATKFIGDFSDVVNIPYNQEWNDQGSYMYPFDLAGDENMIIGGGTIGAADSIFNPDGSVVINEQAQNSDFRIEGQTEDHLFNTNAFNDTVGINRVGAGADLTINGATSYRLDPVVVTAGTGITLTDHQSTRVLLLESSGACNVDLTASPQIAAGEDGQIITLMGRYSDEIITIEDGDGVALNNNVSIDLRAKDSITLMYSAALGEWLELSRVDYIERATDSLNRGTCI